MPAEKKKTADHYVKLTAIIMPKILGRHFVRHNTNLQLAALHKQLDLPLPSNL